MAPYFFRIAQEIEYDNVAKHLLVVGELTGDCFNCRAIGIDYSREKYCPECNTDFKYISYRREASLINSASIARLCQKRPDLVYIEYSDIKEIADKLKVKNIFK